MLERPDCAHGVTVRRPFRPHQTAKDINGDARSCNGPSIEKVPPNVVNPIVYQTVELDIDAV